MNTFFLATRANKSGDGHASEHASAGAAGAPAAVAAPSAAEASPLRPRRAITLADLRARLRVSEDSAASWRPAHSTETPSSGGGDGAGGRASLDGRGGPPAATGGPSTPQGVVATAPPGLDVGTSKGTDPLRVSPGGLSSAVNGHGHSPPLQLLRKSSVAGAGPPGHDSAPDISE